ncbi:hypothetical protein [Alteromonas gilva]|uniref:Uncharacterized protein n=1 Tax=Alteromonas gilva TaxID=2987522 RepID=A0ABT5L8L6_9ALTE|nr:hypothetical protein [Alteromonas gilva]MDC8832806.1 hypothetical protein [Alteromonas gilva]
MENETSKYSWMLNKTVMFKRQCLTESVIAFYGTMAIDILFLVSGLSIKDGKVMAEITTNFLPHPSAVDIELIEYIEPRAFEALLNTQPENSLLMAS